MIRFNPSTPNPRATRRQFLKAAGVTIALPALESLANPSAAPPKRMVFMISALGVNPEAFFPRSFGRDYELSPTLKPLMAMKEDFTVFSHMDHPSIYTKHASANSFLSGVDARTCVAGENVSIDQLAAAHVGYQTRFPSVHISIGGSQGASWTPSGIKVREETDPLDLFQKLFVNDSAAANRARRAELTQQASVLDLVRSQVKRIESGVSAQDRAKLDEYLTAIREAEASIQGQRRWQEVPKPNAEVVNPANPDGEMGYAKLSPLMFDLLFLAIQSDSSRVFTAGFGVHNGVIALDGVKDGYHTLSHHGKLPERLRQLRIIDAFYVEQMARFLAKLKNAETHGGNLLNQTMVLFGSGLGDASVHSNRDLPLILAGGGFKHGAHLDTAQSGGRRTPLNNLYTTMLRKFGVEIDRFNDATGTFSLS